MRWKCAAVFFCIGVLAALPAGAEDIHGRVDLGGQYAAENSQSLSAALGERTRADVLGDARLTWEPRWGAWSFALAYQLTADEGDTPALTMRSRALGIFPPAPPATWWNLSDTFIASSHLTATQRIDRLSIGYTGANFVLRLGRQALTWGGGLVFRPMDLFDPFAPGAIDTEYKPGTDMAYGQWLFDDGSDVQLVIVPRPARKGGEPASNASSFAVRSHVAFGGLQTTWLVARDHGDWVAAVGLDGSLGGATWNAELIPTFVRGGRALTSVILNISDATILFGRDATVFAEYYRNGFGLSSRGYALDDLPGPLTDRLLRGQVFNTGRDYLAAGATLQWTPLLQIGPTLITNIDDGSFYGIVQATYSLRQDLNLVAGAQIPVGAPRTEFGGIPLMGNSAPYYEQTNVVYLQLRQYF
jgi:hypothetical protein